MAEEQAENTGTPPSKYEGDEINIITGTKAALQSASKREFDEFYTRLPDIEAEMTHYKDCFRDKVVYCNCDKVLDLNDPHSSRNSKFFTYFHDQFQRLGLKLLICSWYEEGFGVCNVARYDGNKITLAQFQDATHGSYDGPIATRLLAASDVVVTNPPFSKFKQFFSYLMESGKQFLIVAPTTCPSYKQVFPALADYACRFGYTSMHKLDTIEDHDNLPKGVKGKVDKKTGDFYLDCSCVWLTNLNLDAPPSELPLWNKMSNGDFCEYDNCPGAIDVPVFKDIPADWTGIIGTSVSFFNVFNPKQFKVWGLGIGNLLNGVPNATPLKEQFAKDYVAAGGRGWHPANQRVLGFYDKDGVPHVPFARVLIQQRKYIDPNK